MFFDVFDSLWSPVGIKNSSKKCVNVLYERKRDKTNEREREREVEFEDTLKTSTILECFIIALNLSKEIRSEGVAPREISGAEREGGEVELD